MTMLTISSRKRKISGNCNCLFIWGPGGVFFFIRLQKSRDTVPLITTKMSHAISIECCKFLGSLSLSAPSPCPLSPPPHVPYPPPPPPLVVGACFNNIRLSAVVSAAYLIISASSAKSFIKCPGTRDILSQPGFLFTIYSKRIWKLFVNLLYFWLTQRYPGQRGASH